MFSKTLNYMGIFDTDLDPGMRFESFLREAFDCRKMQDPWAYAGQEEYNNFIKVPTPLRGKRALSTALIALILKHKDSEIVDKLKELEDKVWELETQDQAIEIIDEGIAVLKELNN